MTVSTTITPGAWEPVPGPVLDAFSKTLVKVAEVEFRKGRDHERPIAFADGWDACVAAFGLRVPCPRSRSRDHLCAIDGGSHPAVTP